MLHVGVESYSGKLINIRVGSSDSVDSLKQLIFEREHIPVSVQCVLFAGRMLQDNARLSDCGIKDGSRMFLLVVGISHRMSGSIMSLFDQLKVSANHHFRVPCSGDDDCAFWQTILRVQKEIFQLRSPLPADETTIRDQYQAIDPEEAGYQCPVCYEVAILHKETQPCKRHSVCARCINELSTRFHDTRDKNLLRCVLCREPPSDQFVHFVDRLIH